MIGVDSVIALANGFVCADKLRIGANAFTMEGNCKVTRLAHMDLPTQVHVATKHFSIIMSPDQLVVLEDGDTMMAADIREGEVLFCSTGPEKVEKVGVTFLENYSMIEVATDNGYLVSNGFHLYFGEWQ